ncbi:hypothetical protein [Polaromonas sp. UC242_47]|uniref:hypothetical protein n=1 Tax=Polaromonas sp. UC242_47 TaxID=3374626 RepID=UPI003794E77B
MATVLSCCPTVLIALWASEMPAPSSVCKVLEAVATDSTTCAAPVLMAVAALLTNCMVGV